MSNFSVSRVLIGTQRNDLRKLARSHPAFDKWRAINDPPNAMKKPEIFKAIIDLGLVDEALKILGAPQATTLDSEAFDAQVDEVEADPDMTDDGAAMQGEGDTSEASPVDVDVESVLGPVRPFLAPVLVASMESALRPIVIAAHKPAQTIVQAAPVVLKAGEAPHATRIGASTMAKVFMVGGAKGKRPVALWNDPLAAKPDAGYVMDGASMYVMASALEAGEVVWLAGPAGSGKRPRRANMRR